MSSRHHNGLDKPPGSDRRVEHHRERRAAHVALAAAADPDTLIDPRRPHTLHREHREREVQTAADDAPRRRLRHWKTPFWKRRNALRRERNRAIADLAGQ